MDKTLYKYFLVYATVLNKIDAASESDELRFSSEERNAYIKVHEAAESNDKISEFLRKIKECNSADRLRIVEDFFVKKEEPKNEEEEIAKVYGVDSKNIQSKTLSNGKEILYFYDYKLARLVVLEKNKDGKTLTEYLEDIQKENEKYQSDNDLANASNIMDDQRKKTSMELGMIPINEIGNHREEIGNLRKDEQKKINYLLMNLSQLRVKSINIPNMIYIDVDNNIKELVFDKDNNVRVAEPDGKEFDQESKENIESKVSNTVTADIVDFPQKSNFDDLNSMLKDDVTPDIVNFASKSNPDELNYMLSHTDKESKEVTVARGGQSDTKKARVLSIFRNNLNSANDNDLDKAGFVNNIIFVLLMASVFVALIIEIIYFI